MTQRWITTQNNRRSKKYRALHETLRREIDYIRNPSKPERHKRKSQEFRQTGDNV